MLLSDIPIQDNRDTWLNKSIKYADDITLVGPPQTVINDYETLRTRYDNLNLSFADAKTHAYIPRNLELHQPIITQFLPQCTTSNEGFTVLGIPFGKDDYISQVLHKCAAEYKTNLETASDWITKQQLFKVLQTSASLFQHFLATIPTHLTQDFTASIDSINTAISSPISCTEWTSQMPPKITC